MKTKYWIVVVLIALAIGFFIGSQAVGTKDIVKYVKTETVRDTVSVPDPYYVGIPKYVTLPARRDTVWLDSMIYVRESVDSVALVRDYSMLKKYRIKLFDTPEDGSVVVFPELQYNSLVRMEYERTPVQKEITKMIEPIIVPFASASYNTFGIIGAGGGLFIKNVGIEYLYQLDQFTGKSGHQIGVKVRF